MRERRARLAERRRELGLTQEDLAEALQVERTTVARWETGANTPGLWARRRLADVLHVPLDRIEDLLAAEPATSPTPDGAIISTGGWSRPGDAEGLRALATTAAQSSTAFADLFSSSNVSDDVLEQYGLALSRIATAYVHAPLLPLFIELITLRDNLFALLHGRQSPQQSRDLFLLAGTACLLLAHASQIWARRRPRWPRSVPLGSAPSAPATPGCGPGPRAPAR
jgi:transcriptional regulator with XRE-family HTH domain